MCIRDRPYAYAMQWGSMPSTQALTNMMLKGVVARYATSPFRVDGKDFPAGTILLMRADNRKHPDFDSVVKEVANASVVPFTPIRTGFVESGKDFGSYDYELVRRPKVMALAGEGVRSLNLGEIWHFFEEELKYPIDLIEAGEIGTVALESYNVIVLTEGYYSISESTMEKINDWISAGGRLVAIGSAINKLSGKDGFEIESKGTSEPDTSEKEPPVHHPEPYAGSDRRSMSEDIPGSIFQTTLDTTHPLCFGLGESYWTLKSTTSNYKWLEEGGNAIYLDDTPRYYGFVGYKALEKTCLLYTSPSPRDRTRSRMPSSA